MLSKRELLSLVVPRLISAAARGGKRPDLMRRILAAARDRRPRWRRVSQASGLYPGSGIAGDDPCNMLTWLKRFAS